MGISSSNSRGASRLDAERLKKQAFDVGSVCAAPRRNASSRNVKASSAAELPHPPGPTTRAQVDSRTGSMRRTVPPRRAGSLRSPAGHDYDIGGANDSSGLDLPGVRTRSLRATQSIRRGRQQDEESNSESDDSTPSPPQTRTRTGVSRMPAISNRSSIRPSIAAAGRSSSTAQARIETPSASGGTYPKGTCDKCDGAHLTDSCPIYKRKKEDHPDAWRNFGRKTPLEMGKGGGNFKLKNARVVRQPGDGNCLFHSMSYALPGTNATSLRREIAAFIKVNGNLEIADTPLKDWIKWDSQTSVSQYASRMAETGWGGGIEMAACSHLKRINVHVYERGTYGSYKRISCFDVDGARKTAHVLYRGGVHYDVLVPP